MHNEYSVTTIDAKSNVCCVKFKPDSQYNIVFGTADHNLYYRGNYNKTRYCTDAESNYAQMAIDSLLKQNNSPSFNALALRAYGCSLPNCTK